MVARAQPPRPYSWQRADYGVTRVGHHHDEFRVVPWI